MEAKGKSSWQYAWNILMALSANMFLRACYMPGTGLDPWGKRWTKQTLSSPSETYTVTSCLHSHVLFTQSDGVKYCEGQRGGVTEALVRGAEVSLGCSGKAVLEERLEEALHLLRDEEELARGRGDRVHGESILNSMNSQLLGRMSTKWEWP